MPYTEDQKGDYSQGLMASEYRCTGCHEYEAWTPDEMPACIVCKRHFCKDCVVEISGEKFCIEHARCKCGQPAIASCDDCGDLMCAAHLAERIDPDRTRDLCYPMCAVRTPDSPERKALIAKVNAGHKDVWPGTSIPGRLPDRPGPRVQENRSL